MTRTIVPFVNKSEETVPAFGAMVLRQITNVYDIEPNHRERLDQALHIGGACDIYGDRIVYHCYKPDGDAAARQSPREVIFNGPAGVPAGEFGEGQFCGSGAPIQALHDGRSNLAANGSIVGVREDSWYLWAGVIGGFQCISHDPSRAIVANEDYRGRSVHTILVLPAPPQFNGFMYNRVNQINSGGGPLSGTVDRDQIVQANIGDAEVDDSNPVAIAFNRTHSAWQFSGWVNNIPPEDKEPDDLERDGVFRCIASGFWQVSFKCLITGHDNMSRGEGLGIQLMHDPGGEQPWHQPLAIAGASRGFDIEEDEDGFDIYNSVETISTVLVLQYFAVGDTLFLKNASEGTVEITGLDMTLLRIASDWGYFPGTAATLHNINHDKPAHFT